MVSLAFHLFVVGTVIFALCSYGFDCSRPLICCRQYFIRLVIVLFCFLHLMLAGRPPFGFL